MHTLEQLVSFVAVYEAGSYSAAAKAVQKSRATVREQVISYEDGLGFPLFTIDGRKARPTPQADALYLRAKLLIRQSEELESFSQAFFSSEVLSLTLYHDAAVPPELLVFLEKQMRRAYPQVSLNWLHRNREEAFEGILRDTGQLAILQHQRSVHPEREINFASLGNLALSIYVGPDSPLLEKPSASLREVQLYTQYVSENDINAGHSLAKLAPKYHVVSNVDVMCQMISCNGWGLLPDKVAEPYVKLKLLQKLDVDVMVNPINTGLTLFFRQGAELKEEQAFIMRCCRYYAVGHLG
ncbi:LysR family transcriptional regulator [Photobacterium lutimaris]|uniref:LysR family transcriptional regulator n=1 Tax=Photobacterium lutimaris TaxID=388278 RepID=A0A2T3IUP8_9GAMM|nr:LysR family transcriptional regulator [Photobacterium lutimaris]PSU32094.1 LysR family transcriptional regulator [Photobacterium lutimaris]TDR73752.1 DNA-binding transcriptional LysR family regulator [Photobacterium lutimaris]